tara:strand:- start:313 stop:570 length:258 start_codon:yes stop_codon:yes gene_type:complete
MNNLFKALSDPTRRAILDLLRGADLSASNIADNFNISKPSISHHLSILHQAELVLRERRGQQIFYSLNTTVFQQVIEWLYNLKGE